MSLRTLVLPDLKNRKSWLYPSIICILAALLFFPGLGSRDFWAPVEPRYAEITRVMFAKGDWLIPTVNGELYTDKPILYFWLVLLASKLTGSVNEWSVRLPTAFSALGVVLTTYFLGRDLLKPRIGFMAATIFATSALVLWEARWAHTDMLLTFFLTLSLYFFSRVLCGIGKKKEVLFSYALMGLATLTKGLIGIVLPGLILVVYISLRGEWRSILDWRVPWGILIVFLVAGPWFALVTYVTGGNWLNDFIWVHHFQRYTSGFGHRQPFYYYLTTLPADFLPWTIFLVAALASYRSKVKELWQPIHLFLFLWFSVIFVFFSISDTKRNLYLLPAFPPLAVFIACYFDKLIEKEIPETALYRWLGYFLFGILAIGGFFPFATIWFFGKEAIWISVPVSVVLATGGFAGIAVIRSKQPYRVLISTVLTVALVALSVAIWILPFIDRYKSARSFALEVNRIVPSTEPLYIYADSMNDFNYYTRREVIPILSSPTDVKNLLQKVKNIYLLVRDRDIKDLESTEKVAVLAEGSVGSKWWRLAKVTE